MKGGSHQQIGWRKNMSIKVKGNTYEGDKFLVKECGKEMLLKVVKDSYPDNPRTWDRECHDEHMFCWNNGYSLGDEHSYQEPRDFLQEMVRRHISREKVLRMIRKKKTNLELRYDRSSKQYSLMVLMYWRCPLGNSDPGFYCEGQYSKADLNTDWFFEEVLENLANSCMIDLLNGAEDFAMLPIYLFDHSGLAISTTDFICPFDCGQVGYVWTEKSIIMNREMYRTKNGRRVKITEANWKKAAETIMTESVAFYDTYLEGNVYGFELYNVSDDDKCESSSYGYYGARYEENGMLDNFEVIKQIA